MLLLPPGRFSMKKRWRSLSVSHRAIKVPDGFSESISRRPCWSKLPGTTGAPQGTNASLRRGHFDAIPWPTESIDKNLTGNTVYFFRKDATEIREARRVLRPGGTMATYATDKSVMAR
jgi:hypothetical protein